MRIPRSRGACTPCWRISYSGAWRGRLARVSPREQLQSDKIGDDQEIKYGEAVTLQTHIGFSADGVPFLQRSFPVKPLLARKGVKVGNTNKVAM